jgi:hypothetical protein
MIGSRSVGSGLAHGILEGHGTGDLERHLGGVDLVEGAIEQRDLDVHHRIAGEHAASWRPGRPGRPQGYTPWGSRRR